MALASNPFQAVAIGTPEQRVEALQGLLGYPVKQRDPGGSRFWYLRPGEDADEAEYTCPIAVGFYSELDDMERGEVPRFLTAAEQQQEIYGHYTNRVIPDQPVMYLLLPEGAQQGTVAMILPAETTLRQRQIQTFAWDSEKLENPLNKLKQGTLRRTNRMQETALSVVPLVEWAFYKPIETAKELAQKLAGVSRKIEQAIPAVYEAEGNDGYLHNLLTSFQRELLPTLKLKAETAKDYSFADIYAQTIAYGLFTARVFSYTVDERERRETDDPTRKERDFNRQTAWELLPETNPFLRRLFRDVSQQPIEVLGDELGDAISEVFSILRAAKMEAILEDFRSKMNREDIVIQFYEPFLKAYKPKMRERLGVYYTPEPVVSYMVRSVDILLKEKFDKPLGLADPEVMILDPACGTGTFLLWIFQLIHQRFEENPEALTEGLEDKTWSTYVKERLLPRIFGFELLMAPYAIAHLKLGLFLEETGYKFDGEKRLGVYLTNSLDNIAKKSDFLLDEYIAEESDQAIEIKQDKRIMVVLGNPPYSISSENKGEWISGLLKTYKEGLKEKKLNLDDDFIKFIRFAQWRIEKTTYGVLAFISNNSYLDGITHRRMRESIIETFDEVYLLDLHGSSKKKEKCPDGTDDNNVFDIQQGVSIGFFIKSHTESLPISQRVKFSELWGLRSYKYSRLSETNFSSTVWEPLLNIDQGSCLGNFFFFNPKAFDYIDEYCSFYGLRETFSIFKNGIKTDRDSLFFDFDKEPLEDRIQEFYSQDGLNEKFKGEYKVADSSSYDLLTRRKNTVFDANSFYPCLYRPFDTRWLYYSLGLTSRPAWKVMKHMIEKENLCLVCLRQSRRGEVGTFLIGKGLINKDAVSIFDIASVFPLYLYPDNQTGQQSISTFEDRRTNFAKGFLSFLSRQLGYMPSNEAILYYIYSILYSGKYRERYSEFLSIDFPRIPYPNDRKLFQALAVHGERLVQIHLMEFSSPESFPTSFEHTGNRTVTSRYPKFIDGKVIINKHGAGFVGVSEEIWNFHIGGYQVCHKWLKDRQGLTLSDDDILHYHRIVVALKETIILMQKIDEAVPF